MALRTCKECGREVSNKAKACVGCGAPLKRESSPIAKLFVLVVVCAVIFVVGEPIMKGQVVTTRTASAHEPTRSSAQADRSANRSERPKKPEKVDIQAGIAFTGTQLVITNNNTFDWTGVSMHLNTGILFGGYALKADRILAGQTYTVGVAEFTRSNGERFNPFTHKPKDFMIDCDQGLFTGQWK